MEKDVLGMDRPDLEERLSRRVTAGHLIQIEPTALK